MEPNYQRFPDLQAAWEGINEYLVLNEQEIMRRGGGLYGSAMVSYNNLILADKAIISPDFDFGKVLGYSIKKWSGLVKNYVDFHYLDMLRAEIGNRKMKIAKSYNYAYHFKNKHGSGKDCLISLNFTKRLYSVYPVVTFYTRTNEVTKRLIWDFLLVQRIVEYIYGSGEEVKVQYQTDSFFATPEGIMMYDNVKPLKKFFKKLPPEEERGRFQKKVVKTYNDFSTIDIETVTFRVTRRSIAQLQKDDEGNPISGVKSLLASEIPLFTSNFYPKDVITKKQITKFKEEPEVYRPGGAKKRGRGRPPKEKVNFIENQSPKKTIILKKKKKKLKLK